MKRNGFTTRKPVQERQDAVSYCEQNHCYTPTEFALFGVGAIIMGTMVGVVGVSWFKSQCLPDEKEELRSLELDPGRQTKIIKTNNFYPDLPVKTSNSSGDTSANITANITANNSANITANNSANTANITAHITANNSTETFMKSVHEAVQF